MGGTCLPSKDARESESEFYIKGPQYSFAVAQRHGCLANSAYLVMLPSRFDLVAEAKLVVWKLYATVRLIDIASQIDSHITSCNCKDNLKPVFSEFSHLHLNHLPCPAHLVSEPSDPATGL